MNHFFRHKGIWILTAAAVLAVAVFACSYLMEGRANPFVNILHTVTTPVRSAMASVAEWMEDRYNYAFRYEALEQENSELKQRLAELEEQAREGAAAAKENERLRELLELREKRRDFVMESATVTARGATNWASVLTVSKGSIHGVTAGNCVVDEYGNLVGVVTEVARSSCRLITVVDSSLELGGLIARTDSPAIAEGDFALMGDGKLKLTYLPEDTQIIAGDQVLTSGMGGVYPAGLVIGRIEEIFTEVSGMGRYAIVSPAADLKDIKQVFIIKDFYVVE